MPRIIFISALLIGIQVGPLFAQQSNYLDERAGFKQFELGEKVRLDSTKLRMTDPAKLEFTYLGNCFDELFDYDIDKIVLGYDAEKEMDETELVQIFVQFKSLGGFKESNENRPVLDREYANIDLEGQKFQDLKNKLDSLFGKGKVVQGSDPIVMVWLGEEVYMLLYAPASVWDGIVPLLEIGYRDYKENKSNLKKEF